MNKTALEKAIEIAEQHQNRQGESLDAEAVYQLVISQVVMPRSLKGFSHGKGIFHNLRDEEGKRFLGIPMPVRRQVEARLKEEGWEVIRPGFLDAYDIAVYGNGTMLVWTRKEPNADSSNQV